MCDLDPKVKVIGKKAGICDGVPSTAALFFFSNDPVNVTILCEIYSNIRGGLIGYVFFKGIK